MKNATKNKISRDYLTHLMNLRNDFFNKGLETQAIKVQQEINKIIKSK